MNAKTFAVYFLKFGGLALSAFFTVMLFYRLFAPSGWLYAMSMAFLALVLFEGGSVAWSFIYQQPNKMRWVAGIGMWFCVVASVVSSGFEIVNQTKLYAPLFDMNAATLFVIVAAFAMNLMGVVLYEHPPEFADTEAEPHPLFAPKPVREYRREIPGVGGGGETIHPLADTIPDFPDEAPKVRPTPKASRK